MLVSGTSCTVLLTETFTFYALQGLLPIHCAASHGLTAAIQALLSNGSGVRESLQQAGEEVWGDQALGPFY